MAGSYNKIILVGNLTRDPEILGGIPVFAGTRVPVETLLTYLKTGGSLSDFLMVFPSVRAEQRGAEEPGCSASNNYENY